MPTEFHLVRTGETYDVIWDARALTMWRVSVDCNDPPPLPVRRSSFVTGVPQPVDPGRYRIILGVESTLPVTCNGAGPDFPCDVTYATNDESEIAPRCTTSSSATTDFSLPASGDIVISLDLT